MFTGSQDLYQGVYTDLIIGNWEKCWITNFQMLIDLIIKSKKVPKHMF